MKRLHVGRVGGWALVAGTLALGPARVSAQAPGDAEAPAAGLRAVLTVDGATREVFLLGRTGTDILYRLPTSPAGVSASLRKAAVQRAEFDVAVDERAVVGFARRRQWLEAAQQILRGVQAALPYLDLPDNNATDWAIRAGVYLRRAAAAARETGADPDTVRRLMTQAYSVLSAAGRAEWHYYGEVAQLRAVLCLIELGRLDEAERALARVRKPDRGDLSYGMYRLAQGELLFARGKPLEAMDSAVQSVIYENKDIESFPDALTLTAKCYEEFNEMHRTRDIYYEVARLFRGTDWGDHARGRLRRIMREGLAAEVEAPEIEKVFFGSAENLDEVIQKFLAESEGEKEIDVDGPADQVGAEPSGEGG